MIHWTVSKQSCRGSAAPSIIASMSQLRVDRPSATASNLAKNLRHAAEAAAYFLFIGLFRILGVENASAVGGYIGRNVFFRFSAIMNRARENLRAAFPDKSDGERESIVREMCDNLGRTVAEYAHLDKFSINGPAPRIEVADLQIVESAIARGKAIIFVSGHFANWELLQFAAAQIGLEGGAVYRPLNNPIIDGWLVRQRARYGASEQIAKGPRGTKRIYTLLRRGKSIFMLADQKTNEGIPVMFFGREAMTTPAPAMFALRLSAMLVPVSNRRLAGSRFRITLHPPIEAAPTGDIDHDIRRVTGAITTALEILIRAYPSNWLWIHRRWPTSREQDHRRGKRALQTELVQNRAPL